MNLKKISEQAQETGKEADLEDFAVMISGETKRLLTVDPGQMSADGNVKDKP